MRWNIALFLFVTPALCIEDPIWSEWLQERVDMPSRSPLVPRLPSPNRPPLHRMLSSYFIPTKTGRERSPLSTPNRFHYKNKAFLADLQQVMMDSARVVAETLEQQQKLLDKEVKSAYQHVDKLFDAFFQKVDDDNEISDVLIQEFAGTVPNRLSLAYIAAMLCGRLDMVQNITPYMDRKNLRELRPWITPLIQTQI